MSFDRNRTLEELENTELGEPEFDSALVRRVHQLYKQPLAEFTVEDLRLVIGQGIGLQYLVPIAVEILEKDALASGDYYPGDLLKAVLSVERVFWKDHQDLYRRVNRLTSASPLDDRQLDP